MFVSIWHDLNINMYYYIFCTLAYPSFVFLCCFFFFCDDHLFGGSKCGCSVKGTSRGWGAIF